MVYVINDKFININSGDIMKIIHKNLWVAGSVLMTMLFVQTLIFAQTNPSGMPSGTTWGTDSSMNRSDSTQPGGTSGLMNDTTHSSASYYRTADDLTNRLSARLDLKSNQQEEIRNILIGYQRDMVNSKDQSVNDNTGRTQNNKSLVGSDVETSIGNQIENVLDTKQQNDFREFRSEWFGQVSESIQASHPAYNPMNNDNNSTTPGTTKDKNKKKGSGMRDNEARPDKTGTGSDTTGTRRTR